VRRCELEILADLPSQRAFTTAAEVAASLREERDTWDRWDPAHWAGRGQQLAVV